MIPVIYFFKSIFLQCLPLEVTLPKEAHPYLNYLWWVNVNNVSEKELRRTQGAFLIQGNLGSKLIPGPPQERFRRRKEDLASTDNLLESCSRCKPTGSIGGRGLSSLPQRQAEAAHSTKSNICPLSNCSWAVFMSNQTCACSILEGTFSRISVTLGKHCSQ